MLNPYFPFLMVKMFLFLPGNIVLTGIVQHYQYPLSFFPPSPFSEKAQLDGDLLTTFYNVFFLRMMMFKMQKHLSTECWGRKMAQGKGRALLLRTF